MKRLDSWLEKYGRYLFPLWILVSLGATLAKMKPSRHNNFTIFRTAWTHLEQHLPLYVSYPEQYHDLFLYAPPFAVLVAPFALLPEPVAYLAWCLGLAGLLFWAIRALPVSDTARAFIALFTLNELVTGLMMQQFNVAIGAFIILSYVFVRREKDIWAALFMALGLTTKLYGIVALAFFPLSRHKVRYVLWSIVWTVLLLLLPFLWGVDYAQGQYAEWLGALAEKNASNILTVGHQNTSLLGMLRKISQCATYSDWIPIGLGAIAFAVPFLRIRQYRARNFGLFILASTLCFPVLFSTGSESSSYVILFPALALWYWLRREYRSGWDLSLLVGAFILSSLSPTDIFPRMIREGYVQPYALKALFPTLIWCKIVYELLTVDFLAEEAKGGYHALVD